MSEIHTLGISQRLQGIRRSLNLLMVAYKGKDAPVILGRIRRIYQKLDHWETLEPEEIDSQALSVLESFMQREYTLNMRIRIGIVDINIQGLAYLEKFQRWGDLRDLEEGITNFQRVVDLTPDSEDSKPGHYNNLAAALLLRFRQSGSLEDLDGAISYGRKAIGLSPDNDAKKPRYLSFLGSALQNRFIRHGSLADLEDSILQKRMAVELSPDGHSEKPGYLSNLGNALEKRFDRHGRFADLEEAVVLKRKAVDLTDDGHFNKPGRLNNFGNALLKCFNRNGKYVDLIEAISRMEEAVELTPDVHPDKPMYLCRLAIALERRFDRHGISADLDSAISQIRKAVNLTPDGHPDTPRHLNELAIALEKRFRYSGGPSDLEDSIFYRQQAIHLEPNSHAERATLLSNLSRGLKVRFERRGEQEDLQNALSNAREAAESLAASSMIRLKSAFLWAECCKLGSTSSLPAFECAIKLLPRVAWLGLPMDDQYFPLARARAIARAATEAAIAEGENTKAIEWAEQGRSIVWQNLLSLRTPLDQLRTQYPKLASQLWELSQSLEKPTEVWSTSNGLGSAEMATSPIKTAMEWDILVEEIKTKPGFGSFMMPKSLEEMAPVARDGAVVFLNVGLTRCDALTLIMDETGILRPLNIPLERVTPENSGQLSSIFEDLLRTIGVGARDFRKPEMEGLPDDKNSVFKEVLRILWLDIVKPILEALDFSVNRESPRRIWWCTTGPLAFLPFHAAGEYDIKEVGHKLSDYVVSSYAPSITALLDRSLPGTCDPKILTVAMSTTPGATSLPNTKGEAEIVQRLAANLPTVTLANEKATKERVLKELEHSSWVHFACHGKQIGGKPTESCFLLHNGELQLSEIIKARFPQADFAYLSACETAVGDGGIPEESAHLAAGLLFAGYRGVVATMWSIKDDIAPRVAEDFYRYMFRHGKPKREEAAYALHRAVRTLQESGVPFASWVPFIYVGR